MNPLMNTNGKDKLPTVLKQEIAGEETEPNTNLEELITDLNVIRSEMLDLEHKGLAGLENLYPPHAKNLLHFVSTN